MTNHTTTTKRFESIGLTALMMVGIASVAPQTANAGDDTGEIIVRGVLGGLLAAAAEEEHRHHGHRYYASRHRPAPWHDHLVYHDRHGRAVFVDDRGRGFHGEHVNGRWVRVYIDGPVRTAYGATRTRYSHHDHWGRAIYEQCTPTRYGRECGYYYVDGHGRRIYQ